MPNLLRKTSHSVRRSNNLLNLFVTEGSVSFESWDLVNREVVLIRTKLNSAKQS